MNKRIYLILAGFLFVCLVIWFGLNISGNGNKNPNQISFRICLSPKAQATEISLPSSYLADFQSQFWIDASRQFFAKSFLLPQLDTILISSYNGTLPELLRDTRGDLLETEELSWKRFTGVKAKVSHDQGTYPRLIIEDKKLKTVSIIDFLTSLERDPEIYNRIHQELIEVCP